MTSAFLNLSFDILFHGVIALFGNDRFFNALFKVSIVEWLLGLFIICVMLNGGKAEENVMLQILVLNVLPRLREIADCTLSKKNLILCELTILT
jgi:hypothetical protein